MQGRGSVQRPDIQLREYSECGTVRSTFNPPVSSGLLDFIAERNSTSFTAKSSRRGLTFIWECSLTGTSPRCTPRGTTLIASKIFSDLPVISHHALGSGGTRWILESSGCDQTTRRISFDVLRAQGGCCNCEILCNVPSSRGLHNRRIIVQGPAIRIN